MSAARNALPYSNSFEHLNDELRWLDLLIQLRIITIRLQNQEIPEEQTGRTMYITPEEINWLLEQEMVQAQENNVTAELRTQLSQLEAEIDKRVEQTLKAGRFLALPQLGHLFGLSKFELKIVMICLAPELRRKYDRLYAYLQDDITRKRPSVDLVLEMLCETEVERWNARRFLSLTAPLLRAGLLERVEDPHSPSGSSGLAQFLRMDPRICQFLLGNHSLDARLMDQARLDRVDDITVELSLDTRIVSSVLELTKHYLADANANTQKLIFYLHGPYGVGKRDLTLHTCSQLGYSLLSLDVGQLLAQGQAGVELLHLAFREGLLQQAVLYLEQADALLQETARPLLKALEVAIAEYGWLVFLSGKTPWYLKDSFNNYIFHTITLSIPDVALRIAEWQRILDGKTPNVEAWSNELATRFRLTPGQIRAAHKQAENQCLVEAEPRSLTLANLNAACRQQSNHKLGELAIKIEPHYSWDDIVLPEDKIAHLHEIVDQVRHHYQVFDTWGFGRKLNHGKGLSVLFTGPPGTGKTMAAEVLAHDLKLDLYKVDLSGVVSKYIGETEKNLSRIFEEAETSNAILFFDEADALFGKRTEISDAHDRYANIETSYLLQKMESYEGVIILATNLRDNMDEAFTRRIRFIVEFPFPDEANRLRIWQSNFPAETPVSPELEYEYLAREFPVAGGNIKNIVLNSAFLAASDGGKIGMPHILQGSRREYEKMGKLWNERIETDGLKR